MLLRTYCCNYELRLQKKKNPHIISDILGSSFGYSKAITFRNNPLCYTQGYIHCFSNPHSHRNLIEWL